MLKEEEFGFSATIWVSADTTKLIQFFYAELALTHHVALALEHPAEPAIS